MISPELLRRFPFFNFMDDKQLKAVAMIADEKNYNDGDDVVTHDTPASKLFFLIEGTASPVSMTRITSKNISSVISTRAKSLVFRP